MRRERKWKMAKPKYGDSAEIFQKELKRMKIVNNRGNIWDVNLTDTHFLRERADMENGKIGWRKMDIRDQIQGMDIGKMEQQPQ